MGQTLSEPVTTKDSHAGASRRLSWVATAMQGWRISMEDAHTAMTDLVAPGADPAVACCAFFAVFDGHGGANVAKYCGAHLHERVARDAAFARGEYGEALRTAFLGMDCDIKEDPEMLHETSGSTAVVALVTPDERVWVGNVGDSRAVLSQRGTALALSHDHKPGNDEEVQRIIAAGGFVEFGRVNGNLALSRAIGDFEFKQNKFLSPEQQIVTANPDIQSHALDASRDEFIVLACDGIWDVMSSQDVVSFVRAALAANCSLTRTAELLMDKCLASDTDLGGVGCDNMTVVLVALLGDRDLDAWTRWVTEGVTPLPMPPRAAPAHDHDAATATAAVAVASRAVVSDSPELV